MADFIFQAHHPALDFLNTLPIAGEDHLRTTDDLVRWMDQAGLIRSGDRPWRFNDNTRISLGLFKHAMQELGFPNMHRLSGTEWMAPIEADRPSLDDELSAGSRHVGLLFTR